MYLTARADPTDVTQGLYSGAEDYITKPYNLSVLIAKIQTVVRRLEKSSKHDTGLLSYKDLSISLNSRRVTVGKQLVHLSPTLFDILVCLLKNKNHAVSRGELAKEVWGYDDISDSDKNKIDVSIKRLRETISSDYIKTVRG